MIRLLIAAAILLLLIALIRSLRASRMVFRDGRVIETRGAFSTPVRDAFKDVAHHGRVSGTVKLYPGGFMSFSRDIDEQDRQRFRNVFGTES
ncbi:hypothetical protein ABI59_13600 [Acidobacteria bacterium Mor1]|nr:hypothetical protein ABI59_13600 [Acidobacteria bacterium Mor1]